LLTNAALRGRFFRAAQVHAGMFGLQVPMAPLMKMANMGDPILMQVGSAPTQGHSRS
jgi:hypothetical protein